MKRTPKKKQPGTMRRKEREKREKRKDTKIPRNPSKRNEPEK